MKKPTVVVDTNLIIAGRWKKKSSSNQIIEKVILDEIDAVYSTEIKNENLHILKKVKPSKEHMDRILKFYRLSKKVYPKRRITVCSDNADNRFLEAAVAGKADYIISSDMHLLDLKEFDGIRILKPSEFLAVLSE